MEAGRKSNSAAAAASSRRLSIMQVVDLALFRGLLDEFSLTGRIRQDDEVRVRKERRSEQTERSPAAAEVKHELAVREARALDAHGQHRLLARSERFAHRAVITATLFAGRAFSYNWTGTS